MARLSPIAVALALLLIILAGRGAVAQTHGGEKIPELFESSFANEATGELDRALNDALRILRLDDRNYVANLRVGWLYYSKGRYADAVKFYEKAISLAPRAIEPKLGIMLPLMAAQRWADAQKYGEGTLKVAPRNYLAASRMAYIHFSLGRYKEAETGYRSVLADYPSDTDMMLGLGWTYVRQGRKAEARSMFEAVLAIRRENLSAKAGLEAL